MDEFFKPSHTLRAFQKRADKERSKEYEKGLTEELQAKHLYEQWYGKPVVEEEEVVVFEESSESEKEEIFVQTQFEKVRLPESKTFSESFYRTFGI